MRIARVTKLRNGRMVRKKRPKSASNSRRKVTTAHRKRSVGNPAHMLTLGFMNPKHKRRAIVAKKAKRKRKSNARRATRKSSAARRYTTSNHRRRSTRGRRNAQRIVVITPKRNGRRRSSRNPTFFGQSVNAMKMAEYIAGGLIGVAVNKAVLPMLPAALTSNNFAATATAVALAAAEWFLASLVSKDFGSAVGFGALMAAGSVVLNTFIPQVGSTIGLSGRGWGDFVPGRFVVPQNPVLDAQSGLSSGGGVMHGAYPVAYGR